MAIQLSVAVRNARINAIETTAGVSAIVSLRTGAQPSSCGAADTGSVLVSYQLVQDWMTAAANGSASVSFPSGTATDTGSAGHFRLYNSAGTTCHMQGSITSTGNGGDLTLDNTAIAAGQIVNITNFRLSDANA